MNNWTEKYKSQAGFTILEMLVSMAVMVVVSGAMFQMLSGSQGTFRSQPEVADRNQRLRVAADMIYRDLLMAGAGTYEGTAVGALNNFLPPVRPHRTGITTPDGEMSSYTDRVSIVYVPPTRSQSSLQDNMSSSGSDIKINVSPTEKGCPTTNPCGFSTGMRSIIFDTTGVGSGYDLFTVTSVSGSELKHVSPNPALSKAYLKDISRVAEARQRTYYLNTTTNQLMQYDGYQSDLPLVDNVVELNFTYYADPDPNTAPKPAPGLGNCVYTAGTPPTPLLATLGGSALTPLMKAQLEDGPTCGAAPNRFDGDLLRIKKVRVQIGVEVAREDLRGGDSTLFRHTGRSSGGERYVPDYRVSFEVTPRNMNLMR